jgi:hypothetical protein
MGQKKGANVFSGQLAREKKKERGNGEEKNTDGQKLIIYLGWRTR